MALKRNIQSAHSPVRVSENQIVLMVKFAEFEEELPFTACSEDIEEHGRLIYEMADRGEFGAVAEQEEP